MRLPSVSIAGRRLGDFGGWETAKIVMQRDQNFRVVRCAIENLQAFGADAQYMESLVRSSNRHLLVRFEFGGVSVEGYLDLTNIKFGQDRCVFDVDVDTKTTFERKVSGRRPTNVRDIYIGLERDGDRGVVASHLAIASLLVYSIAREVIELKKDIANATALLVAGGLRGPISSLIWLLVAILTRALFIALLSTSLLKILKSLADLLPNRKRTKALNLGQALNDVAAQAGYSCNYPTELNRVWVVGDLVGLMEATELFLLAQKVTNSVLLVSGQSVELRQGPPAGGVVFDGYAEFYQYNTNELVGRRVVSLTRDVSESKAFNVPHAVEFVWDGFVGFDRVQFAEAQAKVKTGVGPLDKALAIAETFFSAASRFIRGFTPPTPARIGEYVVSSETFAPKLVMAQDFTGLTEANEMALLNYLKKTYSKQYLLKYKSMRVPFDINTWLRLSTNGFVGIRSLTWFINNDMAEVEVMELVDILDSSRVFVI